ncbi:unnamed protein product [Tuber aestivum]|uniref:Uncharacterized protein n=1 Tax=Tuber aestivum TaxID=59557 RepID=A0A292PIQ0_9PEZI|nr:unnamed protein product [Tuber aestivum]
MACLVRNYEVNKVFPPMISAIRVLQDEGGSCLGNFSFSLILFFFPSFLLFFFLLCAPANKHDMIGWRFGSPIEPVLLTRIGGGLRGRGGDGREGALCGDDMIQVDFTR